VLTGLGYVATYVGALVDGKDLYKLFKNDISLLNHKAPAAGPIVSGTSLVLGALLLVSVFSLSRWRSRPGTGTVGLGPDESIPAGGPGTDETVKDFWTPSTPVGSPLGSGFGDESTTERVPGQFGSPWRTPPEANAREESR
jgi:hypothetical protein